MPTPPDNFFYKQEAQVDEYAAKQVRLIIQRVQGAKRSLQAEIAALDDTAERRRLMQLLQQVERITEELRADLRNLTEMDRDLGKLVTRHYGETVHAITGSSAELVFGEISSDIVTRYASMSMENVTSITADYLQKQIRSALLRGMAIKGQNPRQVALDLMKKPGFMSKNFGHVQTIVRTEASNIYNAQSVNAIAAGNEKYGLSLNKRIVERIDLERNHAISLVTNNLVAPVLDEQGRPALFKVKVSDVREAAKRLKNPPTNPLGGIFWMERNGYFRGAALPAHYNERGITVATKQDITKI